VLVALSVDAEHPDHPTTDPIGNAGRLLDVLSAAKVRATFFVQSSWAGAFPELTRRVVDEGHLLGSHSHWHCIFTSLSDAGIADDLARSRSILGAFADTGSCFRLPGGAGFDDPRVLAAVAAAGYQHVPWSCGGNDWEPGRKAEEVAVPIIDSVRAATSRLSIPLFHSWPDPSAPALKMVLEELKNEASFVRLDQLPP
jgi:peptidoglycan-N-acetylmuramic acid deacetylase